MDGNSGILRSHKVPLLWSSKASNVKKDNPY